MRTPDERLHRRLARGEEAALGELYDRFAPLVHGLAARILDDREAAEQLTREVFAHLWTRPDAYRPADGTLRAWLAGLTHRRAVERLRHRTGPGPVPAVAGRGEGTGRHEPAHRPAVGEPAVHRARIGLRLIADAGRDVPRGRPQAVAAGTGRPAP